MEPNNIFDYFFSLENPAIYGILIMVLLIIIIVLIRNEFIHPLNKRKQELEIENTKLMALFAEIDPDPILRVNNEGKIISANNTALNDFKGMNLIGSNFSSILPDFNLDDSTFAHDNVIGIGDRFFNISIRKIDSLGFKQIYLHDITKRIEYEFQIKEYQKNLKNLRTKLDNLNETEKQRLGKELHDSIGQNISIIKMEVQKYIEDEKSSLNKDAFSSLLKLLDNLSTDVRDISHQLRPRILNEFGLVPALSSLIDSVNNNSSMRGLLSNTDIEFELNEEFELNLYRICQEAITNIVKHSLCKTFFVQLLLNEQNLKLIISDDGAGFAFSEYSKNGHSSLGLLNMKERVSNYNGTLDIEAQPNEGTTLFINFANIKEMGLI